jgi:predicted dehydrogenase
MGHMHFNNYKKMAGVEVAAICDIQKDKLTPSAGITGNIVGTDTALDLSGIGLYTEAEKMFADAGLDAVSITLPTYLHKEYTIRALKAGLNVLCEKPMALDSAQCGEMITAAKETGKYLQVGHCIRFWPEYAETKRLIDSGDYGCVKAATFRRLSLTPTWAWDNWILDADRSGGAMLDLHIHDADYVQYLFGMPCSVFSRAAKGSGNGYDHTVTQYVYGDNKVVTAEGGWMMAESFGFEMSFEIILEKAAICFDCTKPVSFRVCQDNAVQFTPEVPAGDGYSLELEYFVKVLSGQNVPQILTPEQSMMSVRLIEAEKISARTNEQVKINDR